MECGYVSKTLQRQESDHQVRVHYADDIASCFYLYPCSIYSRVAPSSKEHQAELAKERKVLSRVKSYKRKIILAEKQMVC